MSATDLPPSQFTDLPFPRQTIWNNERTITAPSHDSFTSRFGTAFPKPHFLESDLGTTAIYNLPPPSGESKHRVLLVHGLNTPALGMLPLARALQALDPHTHIVFYDHWGHGLSSTPLVPHTPHIFHLQIFQVLAFMQWTNVGVHFAGFSFGGPTALRFALHNPQLVSSLVILAPAGLLRREIFGERILQLLDDRSGTKEVEAEAAESVLAWLEGGPLVVPADWAERSRAGEPVAQALREWESQEHRGYRYTVLSVFRDGGITGCDGEFRRMAQMAPKLKTLGVVASADPVCSKRELVELGFENVEEVQDAGHDFVRTRAEEVAARVNHFWKTVV